MALPLNLSVRVLVIDDEKNIRSTLRLCLEGLGCTVWEASSADAALAALHQTAIDLAFLDLRLGTTSGMELIPKLLSLAPELDIILITAYATFDAAVEAVKRGARDFLAKPFTPAQIRHVLERTCEHRAMAHRLGELESRLAESSPGAMRDTHSATMRSAMMLVSQAAASDAAVLFRGESGTGKGLLARMLHDLSARRERPFVTVNCPTLSEQLLSSELFGHLRGSFTGAVRDQPGRVEQAEGGTLFLDEISEMTPPLQAQLLRFVQDKQFERLGEGRTRTANVRIVAATNRNLEIEVKDGRFREDLLYRLNIVEVVVPPLRERRDDILPLARQFLSFFARATNRPVPTLSPETESLLLGYPWPGNVRELRNAMERTLIVSHTQRIDPHALPERIAHTSASQGMALGGQHSLEEIEREHVLRVLASVGSQEEAANILGIDVSTLYRKRRKWESS